ncbi:hypothetical protein CEXT_535901 [Caerostris extrusa]|uniref:Uncharacterized protein n=1 Tax=Caerostris extrusa TaxID=172846 RepID=A0AAV4QJW3_CAEEX|nr:hypothetical protein CEXT_535901 [Caerostris extrusa]
MRHSNFGNRWEEAVKRRGRAYLHRFRLVPTCFGKGNAVNRNEIRDRNASLCVSRDSLKNSQHAPEEIASNPKRTNAS